MPDFDVSSHPILYARAHTLAEEDPAAFAAHNDLAEFVLEVRGGSYDGDDLIRVELAVALQVSYQVERGLDPLIYQSKSRGARSWTYREVEVSPLVPPILNELSQGDWNRLTSVRNPGML